MASRPCTGCGSTWIPATATICGRCVEKQPESVQRKQGFVVDWNAPLFAVHEQDGREIQVHIDKSFAAVADGRFVRFPCNVWTKRGPSGTWLVTHDGLLAAGISPDGYNSIFTVRNKLTVRT